MSPEFQAQVQQLLVRRGLRDEAGKWGFEVIPSTTPEKFDSLDIRSISIRKVKPYTEWWGPENLLTIRLSGTKRLNAKIISWQPRAFPFTWMPAKVESSGVDVTLTILDRAFKTVCSKLGEILDDEWGISGTNQQRAALADIYFTTENGKLASAYREDRARPKALPHAIEWVAEGIPAELIIYAFADPFTVSELVREGSDPVFTLEDAHELSGVALHTIASLYPLDESIAKKGGRR